MTLEEIREEIDQIDQQMKALFLKRMDCARRVAETKARTGGDVYVAEREAAMVKRRTSDIADEELKENYRDFLTHTICISRKHQYGILTKMQDETVRALLAEAGLEEGAGKEAVRVSLRCREEDLHRYMDMAALNHVSVKEMAAKETEEGMAAELLLKGNVNHAGCHLPVQPCNLQCGDSGKNNTAGFGTDGPYSLCLCAGDYTDVFSHGLCGSAASCQAHYRGGGVFCC